MKIKFLLLIIFIKFLPTFLNAEEISIEARNFNYDNKTDIAIARGQVELRQNNELLFADKLVYDKFNNKVYLEGNVRYIDDKNNIYYADSLFLNNNLKQGIINHFYSKLKNEGMITANEAIRYDENKFIFIDANYTACQCDKDEKPAWNIKSSEMKYNSVSDNITHKDSHFEIKGHPVFYLPYFVHPSPKAERRSGFLAPKYFSSSSLGAGLEIPYYINIMPEMDLVVRPRIYTKENPLIRSKFRHLTEFGQYKIDSSITVAKNYHKYSNNTKTPYKKYRWHFIQEGEYFLKDNLNIYSKLANTSDRGYLRKYRLSDEDYLRSIISAFKTENHNHYSAQFQTFKNLRDERENFGLHSPYVIPEIKTYNEFIIGENKGYLANKFNFLNIFRNEGNKIQRFSNELKYILPFYLDNGHIITFENDIRGDLYFVHNERRENLKFQEYKSRFFPTSSIIWKYPFLTNIGKKILYFEPIANINYTPYGSNKKILTNEDSPAFEISHDNLFLTNRFNGLDVIEEGMRGAYGIKSHMDITEKTNLYIQLGQSFQKRRININSRNDNYDFSDYVGYIQITQNIFSINYAFRANRHNLSRQRNEIIASVNWPNKFIWSSGFLIFKNPENRDLTGNKPLLSKGVHKNLYTNLDLRISKNFFVGTGVTRNFSKRNVRKGPKTINIRSNVKYIHNCFELIGYVERDNVRKGGIKPDLRQGIEISLKTLT